MFQVDTYDMRNPRRIDAYWADLRITERFGLERIFRGRLAQTPCSE